jgi:hypothetical protein
MLRQSKECRPDAAAGAFFGMKPPCRDGFTGRAARRKARTMPRFIGFLALVSLWSGPAQATGGVLDASFPSGKLEAVEVTSRTGDVHIRGARNGARVHATRSAETCAVDSKVEGTTLVVEVADVAGCRVDLDVFVPMGVKTTLRANTGNVFISGVRAPIALQIDQGSAVVGGVLDMLDVHITRGSLSAQGLTNSANVSISNGNVQLFYEKPNPRGAVSLDIGHGNVTLSLRAPAVDVQATTPKGRVESALPQTPGANLSVVGQVEAGSVFIRQTR